MTDQLKDFFIKKLKGFNVQVYEALMDHCVDFMMNAISKGAEKLMRVLQYKPIEPT